MAGHPPKVDNKVIVMYSDQLYHGKITKKVEGKFEKFEVTYYTSHDFDSAVEEWRINFSPSECPYHICGGAKHFDSVGASNYCLCNTPYDKITTDDYCGMSPDKYDITQKQVEIWDEVVLQAVADI